MTDDIYKQKAKNLDETLKDVYELESNNEGRKAGIILMIYIMENLQSNNSDAVNRLFLKADISKMGSMSLIAMIRSFCTTTEKLPAWKQAYIAARARVTEIGKDPNALFLGLPPV